MPIHSRWLPNADVVNSAIAERFRQLAQNNALNRTHHFHGRFENTYVALDSIPQLQPVIELVLSCAREILYAQEPLRYGFWFNEMRPGHITSLHNHDEENELLSACYYIRVPESSGRFVIVEGDNKTAVEPKEGMLLLFPPQLLHEVEENRSGKTRLSVAFNIGPALVDD